MPRSSKESKAGSSKKKNTITPVMTDDADIVTECRADYSDESHCKILQSLGDMGEAEQKELSSYFVNGNLIDYDAAQSKLVWYLVKGLLSQSGGTVECLMAAVRSASSAVGELDRSILELSTRVGRLVPNPPAVSQLPALKFGHLSSASKKGSSFSAGSNLYPNLESVKKIKTSHDQPDDSGELDVSFLNALKRSHGNKEGEQETETMSHDDGKGE